MATFWSLLERSIILQSLITAGMLAVILYMWATGRTPPDSLVQAFWVILGFWFGTKVQHEVEARLRMAAKQDS